MATLPLEDNFTDILGKAQRGLKLSDDVLARRADVSLPALQRVKSGDADELVLTQVAPALDLGADALVTSARKAWSPEPVDVPGLAQFTTPHATISP
jgi:hypothetical protein